MPAVLPRNLLAALLGNLPTALAGHLPAALLGLLPTVLPWHLFKTFGGVLQRATSIAAVVLSGVVLLNSFMACRALGLVCSAALLLVFSVAFLHTFSFYYSFLILNFSKNKIYWNGTAYLG